ncbi:MAG: pilus assembly protein N-terminal domain-containing protein [Acidobacteriota bacterium]
MNGIRAWRAGRRRMAAFALASLLAASSAWAQRAQEMHLSMGQTVMVEYPDDITKLLTADPGVADLNPMSTRQVMIMAKGIGSTDIVIFTGKEQPMIYSVTVGLNIDPLRRLLRETFPAEPIDVRTSGESIVLSGLVSSKEVMDRAAALAAVVAKNVVNNMRLPVAAIEKQVLLRVKFAQLDRKRASDLGININGLAAGTAPSGIFKAIGSITSAATAVTNIHAFSKGLNIEAFIKALENQSILQVLSEPNLVTSNKQEASLLVGGEFPYQVPQGGVSAAVTIAFKEYGIRLRFTPTITPNDTIQLALFQEVSALDFNGGPVPGLTTRRTETKVELGDGQSFIVAGLIDKQASESFSKIPWIGSVPILGTLFKTKAEAREDLELIMMVTPMITSPLSPNDPTPELEYPLEFMKPAPEDDMRGPRVKGKPVKSLGKATTSSKKSAAGK